MTGKDLVVLAADKDLEHALKGLLPRLRDGETKPQRPKEAFLAALHEARVARSASLYGRMAEKVSLRRCADESFQALRRTLQNWFPRAKPA